ncbi:class I SAM-dependent methyltransferase [Candidatus Woesearchaeota archaeon]|nr:class I SAM-dependent methyltransferase [Candidatus Woesearchaeota archaeon]
MKSINIGDEWSKVSSELEQEVAKLKSYDTTLLSVLGVIKGKKILDYGSGPGILASVLCREGADVYAYDISEEMRQQTGQKIGHGNVYATKEAIPDTHFDVTICNLVVCIVTDDEVRTIAKTAAEKTKDDGTIYIGFCNPLIYDCPESRLDIRHQTEHNYHENHVYRKTKKEGNYDILEMHRPLSWYEALFREAGLEAVQTHFTPAYEFRGRTIQDFAIVELKISVNGVKREK